MCPHYYYNLIKELWILLFVLTATALGGSLYAKDISPLFDVCDMSTNSGFIVSCRNDSGGPNQMEHPSVTNKIVDVFSWNAGGDFLAETGFNLSNNVVGAVLYASGTFQGTNWIYRNGAIMINTEPSQGLESQMKMMGGRIPARVTVDKLIGRGMDYRELKTAEFDNDGSLHSVTAGGQPIDGKVLSQNPALTFSFSHAVRGSGFEFLHNVTLVPFVGGGYLPEQIRTWGITKNRTNLISDYSIVATGTGLLHQTFSPYVLFRPEKEYVGIREKVFLVESNGIREVPVRSAVVPHPMRRLIITTGLLALAFVIFCYFRFLRGKTNAVRNIQLQ